MTYGLCWAFFAVAAIAVGVLAGSVSTGLATLALMGVGFPVTALAEIPGISPSGRSLSAGERKLLTGGIALAVIAGVVTVVADSGARPFAGITAFVIAEFTSLCALFLLMR